VTSAPSPPIFIGRLSLEFEKRDGRFNNVLASLRAGLESFMGGRSAESGWLPSILLRDYGVLVFQGASGLQ
jgi:hypothetical protein